METKRAMAWTFAGGILTGILASVLTPLAILATGAIDFGADVKPGLIERTLAPWALDRSLAWRAPAGRNPVAGDPAAIAAGLEQYRGTCIICHGAPGVKPAELAQGLNPPAPFFNAGTDMTDGELFWVIKHGIRMTPMPAFGPTHTDTQIWRIAAFVRHLPELTEKERASLQAAVKDADAHRARSDRETPLGSGARCNVPTREGGLVGHRQEDRPHNGAFR